MEQWLLTMHWTVTDYEASERSKEVYNGIIEGDGSFVEGNFPPEAQIPPLNYPDYAPHTRMNNSRNIGLGIAGMLGAEWNKDGVHFGDYPIRMAQFEAACKKAAEYCVKYRIPVERGRVDTHAEVEMNRGAEQTGKWDIAFLIDRPDLKGARAVGDFMRERISHHVAELGGGELALPQHIPSNYETVRMGDRIPAVRRLQEGLSGIGYFTGRIDGIFGGYTRGAVLTFQADMGLTTDGIFGPRSWAALAKAQPKPKRDIEMADIRKEPAVKDLDASDRIADVAAIGLGSKQIMDANEALTQLQAASATALTTWETVKPFWPLAVVLVGYLLWRGMNAKSRARLLELAKVGRFFG